jgi:hypothetical protein
MVDFTQVAKKQKIAFDLSGVDAVFVRHLLTRQPNMVWRSMAFVRNKYVITVATS